MDLSLHDAFLSLREDEWIVFFQYITWLGNWQIIVPITIIASWIFFSYKLQCYIIPFWITMISGIGTTFLLKLLVARPRPLDALILESDYSFPSGHATIAVTFYGFLFYILSQHADKKWRNILLLCGIILILMVGLSRLYLGVHYVSDVVAGYLVGTCALIWGIMMTKRAKKKE